VSGEFEESLRQTLSAHIDPEMGWESLDAAKAVLAMPEMQELREVLRRLAVQRSETVNRQRTDSIRITLEGVLRAHILYPSLVTWILEGGEQ
jgi:hypothetical protein